MPARVVNFTTLAAVMNNRGWAPEGTGGSAAREDPAAINNVSSTVVAETGRRTFEVIGGASSKNAEGNSQTERTVLRCQASDPPRRKRKREPGRIVPDLGHW